MTQTLRILFLLLMLAWAGVGPASAHDGQRRDRLRCHDISEQHKPQAILADGQSSCRLVPVRPSRVTPTGDVKTQPTHGRACPTGLAHHFSSIAIPACPCRRFGRAVPQASGAKTFIVLRHIIR